MDFHLISLSPSFFQFLIWCFLSHRSFFFLFRRVPLLNSVYFFNSAPLDFSPCILCKFFVSFFPSPVFRVLRCPKRASITTFCQTLKTLLPVTLPQNPPSFLYRSPSRPCCACFCLPNTVRVPPPRKKPLSPPTPPQRAGAKTNLPSSPLWAHSHSQPRFRFFLNRIHSGSCSNGSDPGERLPR